MLCKLKKMCQNKFKKKNDTAQDFKKNTLTRKLGIEGTKTQQQKLARNKSHQIHQKIVLK